MSKLISLDDLIQQTPHRPVMAWVIDATSGKPVSRWISEPVMPHQLSGLASSVRPPSPR